MVKDKVKAMVLRRNNAPAMGADFGGELAFAANISAARQRMHANAQPLSRSSLGRTWHCPTPNPGAPHPEH
jgi:hypothetical protein